MSLFVPALLAVQPPEQGCVALWSVSSSRAATGVFPPQVFVLFPVQRQELMLAYHFFFASVLAAMVMGTRTAQTIAPPLLTAPSWTQIRTGWVMSVMRMMIMTAFLTSCPRALTTAGWSPTQGRKMIMVRWAFRSHFDSQALHSSPDCVHQDDTQSLPMHTLIPGTAPALGGPLAKTEALSQALQPAGLTPCLLPGHLNPMAGPGVTTCCTINLLSLL